jgi:hypothetical protein
MVQQRPKLNFKSCRKRPNGTHHQPRTTTGRSLATPTSWSSHWATKITEQLQQFELGRKQSDTPPLLALYRVWMYVWMQVHCIHVNGNAQIANRVDLTIAQHRLLVVLVWMTAGMHDIVGIAGSKLCPFHCGRWLQNGVFQLQWTEQLALHQRLGLSIGDAFATLSVPEAAADRSVLKRQQEKLPAEPSCLRTLVSALATAVEETAASTNRKH